jgi:uncharacterized protein (DUF302 family)
MNEIKIQFKPVHNLNFLCALWLCLILIYPIQGSADDDITRHGDAYIIYLPSELEFDEVVRRLHSEIQGENWQVVSEMNIGEAVKDFGKHIDNRVISVCKTQYLAKAIEEDPFISLIIPCRFTVFRESTEKGRIVVGFYDPVAEADGLNLKQAQAAQIAANELKAILYRIAENYQE